MTMEKQLPESFQVLDDHLALHTPSGLVVSLPKQQLVNPSTKRLRLDHPRAWGYLKDHFDDMEIYTRLTATDEAQNFLQVQDNGLSEAVEMMKVFVCGGCGKYCNTTQLGEGFKKHAKDDQRCSDMMKNPIMMRGARLFMAKKRCVFVLVGTWVDPPAAAAAAVQKRKASEMSEVGSSREEETVMTPQQPREKDHSIVPTPQTSLTYPTTLPTLSHEQQRIIEEYSFSTAQTSMDTTATSLPPMVDPTDTMFSKIKSVLFQTLTNARANIGTFPPFVMELLDPVSHLNTTLLPTITLQCLFTHLKQHSAHVGLVSTKSLSITDSKRGFTVFLTLNAHTTGTWNVSLSLKFHSQPRSASQKHELEWDAIPFGRVCEVFILFHAIMAVVLSTSAPVTQLDNAMLRAFMELDCVFDDPAQGTRAVATLTAWIAGSLDSAY